MRFFRYFGLLNTSLFKFLPCHKLLQVNCITMKQVQNRLPHYKLIIFLDARTLFLIFTSLPNGALSCTITKQVIRKTGITPRLEVKLLSVKLGMFLIFVSTRVINMSPSECILKMFQSFHHTFVTFALNLFLHREAPCWIQTLDLTVSSQMCCCH